MATQGSYLVRFGEGNPSFFEAQENQEISGLETYNIKKNPRYRDAFSSEIVEVDDDDDDEVRCFIEATFKHS